MNQLSKMINPFYHNNYTKLAKVYKMKREKFSELIEPIRDELIAMNRGKKRLRILLPKQVKKIKEFID